MKALKQLFDNNRAWSEEMTKQDPLFFRRLAAQQEPDFLWIGCSDSRVPANQVVGLMPGEVFVHRNIANVVGHTDMNLMSVLQYSVEALEVEYIIVCGHYGCGGVRAAMQSKPLGLIDNWLRQIKDVYERHRDELEALEEEARERRLCELNVAASVDKICATTIVQNAWARGKKLIVQGCIYGLEDGLLRDLDCRVESGSQIAQIYRMT